MLADQGISRSASGALAPGTLLPGEWLNALVTFIASVLPGWRDDPARPVHTSETALSAQLCSRLNSACRHCGWDFLQFKREEPDEEAAQRAIDLVAAPRGATLWIEGREFTEYCTLLPIECKRLPTPAGPKRDAREYLYSQHSSTGGVQRFKAGHHASAHARAAMIGYVQENAILHWQGQLDQWIDGLANEGLAGWSAADKLGLTLHDTAARVASLRSTHNRQSGLSDILVDHLWVEM